MVFTYELRKKLAALQTKLTELSALVADNKPSEDVLNQITTLSQQMAAIGAQIKDFQETATGNYVQLQNVTSELTNSKQTIAALQQQLSDLSSNLGTLNQGELAKMDEKVSTALYGFVIGSPLYSLGLAYPAVWIYNREVVGQLEMLGYGGLVKLDITKAKTKLGINQVAEPYRNEVQLNLGFKMVINDTYLPWVVNELGNCTGFYFVNYENKHLIEYHRWEVELNQVNFSFTPDFSIHYYELTINLPKRFRDAIDDKRINHLRAPIFIVNNPDDL